MISFDSFASASFTTNPTSYSHTVGSGINGILIVALFYRNDALGAPTTVTFNGASLTRKFRSTPGGVIFTTDLWYLVNPSSGTHSIVVTFSTAEPCIATSASYFGVNSNISAENSNGTGSLSASTISNTVNVLTADSWVVGVLSTDDNSSTVTVTVGTQRGQINGGATAPGISAFADTSTITAGAGTLTATYTSNVFWLTGAMSLSPFIEEGVVQANIL